MRNSKFIVIAASVFFNSVALAVFIKYMDPFHQFFKSSPPITQTPQKKMPNPRPPSPVKGFLQEVISKQRDKIEVCYDEYLRREPKNSNGSMAIKWSLNSSGQVQQPEVLETNLLDEDLQECVLHEVARMTFDPGKFAENTQFSYRFHFRARAPASIAFE